MSFNNRLTSLAINDQGFVFDPSTGQSFNVNPSGLKILKELVAGKPDAEIISNFVSRYSLTPADAERDVMDFIDHMKIYKLL